MWNKVSETIPKKDKDYLVLFESGGHKYTKICGFARIGEKIDRNDLRGKVNVFYVYDGEYGYCACLKPLYWMDIPQFPKD